MVGFAQSRKEERCESTETVDFLMSHIFLVLSTTNRKRWYSDSWCLSRLADNVTPLPPVFPSVGQEDEKAVCDTLKNVTEQGVCVLAINGDVRLLAVKVADKFYGKIIIEDEIESAPNL